MNHVIIQPMSELWWTAMVVTVVAIAALTYFCSRLNKEKLEKLSRKLGYLIVVEVICTNFYLYFVQDSWTLQNNLPLSLCRASILFSSFALITKRRGLVVWAAYLGVSGGVVSILTPDLSYGMSLYTLLDYYFVHGMLVLIPILLIYLLGIRLDRWSVVRAFIYGNVMLLFVFPINYLVDANYMYLLIKPEVSNPFLIGGWPWYIIGFEIAGILHIAIMDVVFRIIPEYRKRRRCRSSK